jgi:hypothetical protein
VSNRELKLKLFQENNQCFYCGCEMILTNTNGKPLPPNSATLEHRISRLYPSRWAKKRRGAPPRKVLACYKCNHNRSIQETLCLSRAEILKRSRGFSLSPRGKPKIIKPLPTVREVLDKLNTV